MNYTWADFVEKYLTDKDCNPIKLYKWQKEVINSIERKISKSRAGN